MEAKLNSIWKKAFYVSFALTLVTVIPIFVSFPNIVIYIIGGNILGITILFVNHKYFK